MARTSRYIAAAILAVLLCLPTGASAGGKRLSATSEQLQALFIQRLVKYVSWPDRTGSKSDQPFIVAATDAKKLKPYFPPGKAFPRFKLVQWPVDDCHVLVMNGIPDRDAAAILARISGTPILTIGQTPLNLKAGVIVNFQMVEGKLRLQVNPRAAGLAGLAISSRLLQIVQIYTGESND